MQVNLLDENYKDDKEFYQAFLEDSIWQSSYVSEEFVNLPDEIPEFGIYFANRDVKIREAEFIETIKICAKYVIKIDRDIVMDERFWHSYLCLYKRKYLLDKYPQLKDGYDQFKRIVIKKFDWENYIYKAILIAQYIEENTKPEQYEKYYQLILQNMDMFNYIIKYEIFRNGSFLIKIMDIIDETGLSKVLKSKIKNRSDLGRDGSEYEGAIVNGLKEGKGTFAWENGDKYTGDFSADTLNGKGTYTYKDGASYKGEFVEGKRSGTGTFTYTDGASYEGEWKEDVIEGTGIYTFSDGLKLEGTFTNNTFLKGTCTRKNKKIVVTYPVENGALTGKAKAVLKSGETYDGDVSNDAFNGSVSIQYKNKDAYTGGITSNQKNGDGTYTWANGAHYTGKWSEDKMNGAGAYYYSGEQYPYLEGNFVNNNPEGNCIYHKDAGTQYTTTWANGVCTAIN